PHPGLPPDPSGPDGPRGDMWSEVGPDPEKQPYEPKRAVQPYEPKRYATQPFDGLPFDGLPYAQQPYAERPYAPQPYDEQAWELPQPSDHRANAPTAPLPSVS
ncbi:MAG: hypothetical protein JWN61_3414, partial [Pseudonocardiales bacterium]|nr:hypothetical protein [Pseudonocardiales bacterium]